MTCSTTFLPTRTKYFTYTSGDTNPLFPITTYTINSTETVISTPTNLMPYDAPPDYENAETCDTISSWTWASVVITFISV